MMTPAVFRIVDTTGRVHYQNITSAQADAYMTLLLAGGQCPGIRSERMDAPVPTPTATPAPPIVGQVQAAASPLPTIEPGLERHALRQAIEARKDAAKRLAAARHAVERAKAFHEARKAEHAALTVAHEAEIQASGANLAEAFKAGGTVAANRVIDRAALTDSETRLATAKAALAQLEAEQAAAETADKAAETYQRLCVMAVKRAHAEALVERLETVKAEFAALATAIDAARFADVPMTPRAQEASMISEPGAGAISEAAARWHRYSAVLREDPQAAWEDQQ
ncbi:hypothetical protein [Paraburkholderia ferrariae]|uniref:Uncharacterized protein n=1 Tax=Paraburkholderia ferrariae TaxID=386056 RepID=A0ABU9RIS4_9BURK